MSKASRGPDTAAVILRWADGQVGNISTNWATAGLGEQFISGQTRGNVIFHGTIYGTDGLMHLDFPDRLVVCSKSKRIQDAQDAVFENLQCVTPRLSAAEQLDEFSQKTWNGVQIVGHFARCVLDDVKPVCDMFQQRHVVEIIEKAYIAARTGKTQRLSTRFPH